MASEAMIVSSSIIGSCAVCRGKKKRVFTWRSFIVFYRCFEEFLFLFM